MNININFFQSSTNVLDINSKEIIALKKNLKKILHYLNEANPNSFPEKWHQIKNIHLILTDKEEIIRLNTNYRKKEYPTDVLTFHYDSNPAYNNPDTPDVEIYLCDEIAKDQAKQYELSIEDELTLLTVHGILHGFGMDHETSQKDQENMQNCENQILSFLQIKTSSGLVSR